MQMPAPSIMAVWQGTAPGSFGGVDVWKHQVTLYLRAGETFDGDPPTAYYRLFRLITKGVPTATGLPMLNSTVHASCYPMDVPSIQRPRTRRGSTISRCRCHLRRREMTDRQSGYVPPGGRAEGGRCNARVLMPLLVAGLEPV